MTNVISGNDFETGRDYGACASSKERIHGGSASSKERVQKYRTRLKGQQRRRLDLYIHISVIDQMRELVRLKHKPMWCVVQDALEAHIEQYHKLLEEQRSFNEEHARVLSLMERVGANQCRTQIDQYNGHVVAFNQRLAKFQHPRRDAFNCTNPAIAD